MKLFKQLRDALDHKTVASYYIKTIFLLEDERNDANFWNGTLSETFLKMLDVYINYLQKHNIPYFWNRSNNFLERVSRQTVTNMTNQLVAIRKSILQNNDTNPKIVCEYLNTPL